MSEPFFTRSDDSYLPTSMSVGPWNPNSLHGRVVVALLAFQIEQDHGDPEWLPARLTVDMYRLPDLSPITVKTVRIRDGHRIRVVDAELFSNGISVARATSQLLRRTQNPAGHIWSPANWQVPSPQDSPLPVGGPGTRGVWAIRAISGAMGQAVQRRVWMSEVRELVGGVPISPWMRVALAADFASPCANIGDQGLGFINTDVTLYLHRLPHTEWIGMETVNHHATDGVAIGECFVYDEEGAIGSSSVTALAQRMKLRG